MSASEPDILASLRRGLEAFSGTDFDSAAVALDQDVVLVPAGGLSPIRGRSAVRAWMEPDAFAEQRIEPLDFTVAGDKVLLRQRTLARGATSGIELDVVSWSVWTFSDSGLVTRIEIFLEHNEDAARNAAGLDR